MATVSSSRSLPTSSSRHWFSACHASGRTTPVSGTAMRRRRSWLPTITPHLKRSAARQRPKFPMTKLAVLRRPGPDLQVLAKQHPHLRFKWVERMGDDVPFNEIVKTMYGTHASRFTGQLSMSQIQEYISKHHSDEKIHGFLDASKKSLQYVTGDKVPLGAVWLARFPRTRETTKNRASRSRSNSSSLSTASVTTGSTLPASLLQPNQLFMSLPKG